MLYSLGFEPITDEDDANEDDDLRFLTYGEPPVVYKVHISDAEEELPDGGTRDTTRSGARYPLWRDGKFVEIFDDPTEVLSLIQEETGYTDDQMYFNAEMTRADARREAEDADSPEDP